MSEPNNARLTTWNAQWPISRSSRIAASADCCSQRCSICAAIALLPPQFAITLHQSFIQGLGEYTIVDGILDEPGVILRQNLPHMIRIVDDIEGEQATPAYHIAVFLCQFLKILWRSAPVIPYSRLQRRPWWQLW